jgi:hypothetical protein
MSSMPVLAAAASLGSLFSGFPDGERQWIAEHIAQVRSGAQCRFERPLQYDADKVVVFKLSDPKRLAVFLVFADGPGAPGELRLLPRGGYDVQANGGMGTYLAYARAAKFLSHQSQTPLTPATALAFFAKTRVPRCPWKNFDDNVWGNWQAPPEPKAPSG